jgi:oligopeptide/dipeptide ABC transporter ATP-binding protein
MTAPTLSIQGVRVEDELRRPRVEIDRLEVNEGETVALVGESACGKSTTMNVVIDELPPRWRVASGRVLFRPSGSNVPVDLLTLTARKRREMLGKFIGYLPQDWAAMDPLLPVGNTLVDALCCHRPCGRKAAWALVGCRLAEVDMKEGFLEEIDRKRPGQCSGGECQRVLFVHATVHRPQLLLADEPTTGQDPFRRLQILRLIKGDRSQRRSALVVTHDLHAAEAIADRTYVIYQGRVVERGPSGDVLGQPRHPYTRALKRCLPVLDKQQDIEPLEGDPEEGPWEVTGCKFKNRCPLRQQCPRKDEEPVLREVSPGREVACHVVE